MKTEKGLFDRICGFDNLLRAARRAQRGKRLKENVARFNFHLERELLSIQEDLLAQRYRPGSYREFRIDQPKPRIISAAPYRDRVVHHALCQVIEPIFDKMFIEDSYACRAGKGTHRAVDRFTQFSCKNRYVLKCDIAKYFFSIDHEILFSQIARKIRDARTLWLIRLIIDSCNPELAVSAYFCGDDLFTPHVRRKGLPIGNLTSQFFANIYLNGFDHFIKEQVRCRFYVRYVDDFVIFAGDKIRLHEVREEAMKFLESLRLRIHPNKCHIFLTSQGVDFLGYRVFPSHRLLRSANARRFVRRLKGLSAAYASGEVPLKKVTQSVQSWIAHAAHADTFALRRKIFGEHVFIRSDSSTGEGGGVGCKRRGESKIPGASWRLLEQQC